MGGVITRVLSHPRLITILKRALLYLEPDLFRRPGNDLHTINPSTGSCLVNNPLIRYQPSSTKADSVIMLIPSLILI